MYMYIYVHVLDGGSLCSALQAVAVLDGASLCSALRLCMCWMEGAFALLSGCACAGWREPLLCSPAVHVLDGGSLCSALQLCMRMVVPLTMHESDSIVRWCGGT